MNPKNLIHDSTPKLIFAHGEGSSLLIREPSDTNPYFPETTIAKLEIDTTCLHSPIVNIIFNSIITYTSNFSGTLNRLVYPFRVTFQLSKILNLGEKIPLKSWNYSIGNLSSATFLSNSFNLTYCDKSFDEGLCDYTVEIIRVNGTLIAGNSLRIVEELNIQNSNIFATAFSKI